MATARLDSGASSTALSFKKATPQADPWIVYDEFPAGAYTNPTPNPSSVTSPDAVERRLAAERKKQKVSPDAVERATNKKNNSSTIIPPSNPKNYMWNLPPHKWSLPTLPTADPNFMGKDYKRTPLKHDYRRGRIWWKYNDDSIEVVGKGDKKTKIDNNTKLRSYGFQFLWNPETFGTQVAIQMDVTPDAKDRFLGAAGFFPATETISFNIRLDRTNDFAAAASKFERATRMIVGKSGYTNPGYIQPGHITPGMIAGYTAGGFLGASDQATIKSKLVDLYQRGTLADIEYLYRAINGPGPGGSDASGKATSWVNGRGIATSDIGFLMPTLMNIDIGPLSYAGYVTALNVNHIAFTGEMIPIRTDVTISLNILATSGLSASQ